LSLSLVAFEKSKLNRKKNHCIVKIELCAKYNVKYCFEGVKIKKKLRNKGYGSVNHHGRNPFGVAQYAKAYATFAKRNRRELNGNVLRTHISSVSNA
jgi:hypothetical protein